MIIDFHATSGPVPPHRRQWTLPHLQRAMDLSGIGCAVVESACARIYRDDTAHAAHLADCRAAGHSFLPAATISLESDLHSVEVARTARHCGFACVVLQGPLFEESRVLHTVLDAISRNPLPVYRVLRYGDLDVAYRVARAHPSVAFVFALTGYEGLELNHRLIELPHVYLSAARSLYSFGQIETACRQMGAERILYAGDWPLHHPAGQIGVVMDAEISAAEQAMILGGNARRLLAQHGIQVPGVDALVERRMPPCPIIDAHGHVGANLQRPDYDVSAEAVIRYLVRGGGERIYASQTEAIFGDVNAGNRMMEATLRQYPDRFSGYLVINPWMGAACLDEIRRCRERGFVGLKPYPLFFEHQLSDPVMDPVLKLAETMNLPILCHAYAPDIRRMLEKRPRLRILAAHMTSEYVEKAQLAAEFPNVVLEMSGAGASACEDIPQALEIAGENKLVYGSDLNQCVLGYTLYPVLCSGLPEGTLRKLLRENTLRFFREAASTGA